MHKNCELIFAKHAKSFFKPGMRVLEVGPEATPSAHHRTIGPLGAGHPCNGLWDSADIKSLPPTQTPVGQELVMPGPYELPALTGHYDIVLSSGVIEQVPHVWTWVKELGRVVKAGGKMILIGPTSWPQESPVDKWRIFPDGMRTLYDYAGFTVELSVYESLDGPAAETCLHCGRNVLGGVADCITIGTKK